MIEPSSGLAHRNLHRGPLLVDEEMADQVWEAWDAGEIDDQIACIAWALMVDRPKPPKAAIGVVEF